MDATCSAAAAAAGLTVQVCFPGARAAVLDNLNRQREEGRLCDLSIQVQGQVFLAHRCVLAASSPYFHDQVLLKNVTTVSLPSVMDPVAFESVLSSAYTGQLSIVHDDIVNYVTVASFLQMWHIVDKCTEILKRPRPPAEAAPGTAPRQQSPSSTDCLYLEREGRRKERKPDALPPLATWRRPQPFPRWGRPRPPSAQHLADSQLDALATDAGIEYANCEEAWLSSHGKAGHFAHDGPGHSGRYHGGFPGGEAPKQKARFQQRGGPPDKNRESGGEDTQEKRRKERREIEADEGVGEAAERKGAGFAPMGRCDFRPVPDESVGDAAGKASVEEVKEKVQRLLAGRDPAPPPPGGHGGGPAPTCPTSARLQWPWSQPEPGPQESCSKDEDEEEEEEDADFECFTEAPFSRGTYDEIADGTGQVSQRPLVPVSPDFAAAGSEVNWPSPAPSRHLPAALPPPSSPPSPPTPSSSSSSLSLAGAPYTGKVHFCHCGKAYTLKSMRDRHVKMQHLHLRPFGCPVCTKSFKMKHHLTKHLKTHGGLRPYECGLCGKKVIWRDSFLRHQARCERLAASASGSAPAAAAAGPDGGFGYGFDDGEGFLATGVKVEEVDFHREMEEGLRGLLGVASELRTQNPHADRPAFKEEARESFSGS